ncbi:hypothetical protein B0T24DRAFT_667824 [Lasiosphaeria ovina]|uniref:DUF6594 domain-containing protein n=1 Tax=Lasiosphaeria ovina TaxID=92902 RepID=A0AAE0N5N6_9PEZI|nr:hypothetical protein B0T24DRAFT_667824 [Lasiosphaeria ovina]
MSSPTLREPEEQSDSRSKTNQQVLINLGDEREIIQQNTQEVQDPTHQGLDDREKRQRVVQKISAQTSQSADSEAARERASHEILSEKVYDLKEAGDEADGGAGEGVTGKQETDTADGEQTTAPNPEEKKPSAMKGDVLSSDEERPAPMTEHTTQEPPAPATEHTAQPTTAPTTETAGGQEILLENMRPVKKGRLSSRWLELTFPPGTDRLANEYCTELNRETHNVWRKLSQWPRVARFHRKTYNVWRKLSQWPRAAHFPDPPDTPEPLTPETTRRIMVPVYGLRQVTPSPEAPEVKFTQEFRHGWQAAKFKNYAILFEHPSDERSNRKKLIMPALSREEFREKLSSKESKVVHYGFFIWVEYEQSILLSSSDQLVRSRLVIVGNWLAPVLSSVLLVGAALVLYSIQDTMDKLLAIIPMTITFSLIMQAFTSASRAGIFVAVAGFVAVEVVFVGNVS